MGDYSVEDLVPGLQENATQALATLCELAGMTPDGLRLHKEDPSTSHKDCPGARIVKNDVIGMVTACSRTSSLANMSQELRGKPG